jgi:outer membrane protein assembly factor BamB
MHTTSTLLTLALLATSAHAGNWPNWRGPYQDGSAQESALPAKFSPTEGVKWAVTVPGLSASVPAVWGSKVFLTAPLNDKQQLLGLCYDAATGKELWRTVASEGDLQWDNKSNLASPSPSTDGERVVFLFADAIAVCCDMDGKQLWKRDFKETHGAFATQWTYGSSPLLDGGKLYIQVLQRDTTFKFQDKFEKGTPGKDMASYILALDPATGKDLWKVIRPSDAVAESREAFSSPVIHNHNGQRQLLIVGGDCITGHDADTGAEQWRFGTWNAEKIAHWRLVPSVCAGDGIALACAPKKNPIYAVKLGGTGAVSTKDLAWISEPRDASSDVSTPAFYEGKFYVLDSDRRTLSCVEPKSGKVIWTGDLGSKAKFESSPTVADGKIYMTNFWGDVFVAKAGGDKFELLSVNAMGDGSKPNGDAKSCRSSIPAANGCLFIRAQDKLYCVGR